VRIQTLLLVVEIMQICHFCLGVLIGPSREYFFFVLLHAVELDGVRSGWLETMCYGV
jgi:hypothetical protein